MEPAPAPAAQQPAAAQPAAPAQPAQPASQPAQPAPQPASQAPPPQSAAPTTATSPPPGAGIGGEPSPKEASLATEGDVALKNLDDTEEEPEKTGRPDKNDGKNKDKDKGKKKKDKKKEDKNDVHTSQPRGRPAWSVLDYLVLGTNILYYMGFITGFIVGVAAVQAVLKGNIDWIYPSEVGIVGCSVMTFAAVMNALLHLFSVHMEKINQITPLQHQAIVMDRINEKFDRRPDLPTRIGLKRGFMLPEPVYDVRVPWPELILLSLSSAGALAGAMLLASNNPNSGLLTMFLSSVVLRYSSEKYDAQVRRVSARIRRDNSSLLNIGAVLGVRMYSKGIGSGEGRDRTQVDTSKPTTFPALAEAMLAGYAKSGDNPAYQGV